MRTALLLVALLVATAARAGEAARLEVPIFVGGEIGHDACAEHGRIADAGGLPDASLTVKSGPGDQPFREIDRLHDGDPVAICDRLGPWLGVVYGSETFACDTVPILPTRQEYTGPCSRGWVLAQYVARVPRDGGGEP